MEPTAQDYFGSLVEEYDSLMQRAVPVYDEMIERLVAYLPEKAGRVLELGCGTGNYSLELARRYPEAELTFVDGAAEMLEATRSRLGPGRNARTIEGTFEEVDLGQGAFDLVTSCIALHHVVDKAALFRRLHASLAPGGTFVFADQMAGKTEASHAINWNTMTSFWRLPGHLTDDEHKSLEEHAALHDHYVPIVDQIRLLDQAGFHDLDCVWRSWMWGIVTARA